MKKFKNLPLFYKIFFSSVAVFLVLLIAGLIVLWAALDEYEANVPNTIAARYFAEIKDGNYEDFLLEGNAAKFEDHEKIKNALLDASAGEELTYMNIKANEGVYTYVVYAGETRLFEFVLTDAGNRTSFGFNKYKLESVNLSISKDYTFKVPVGYKVLINGTELGDSEMTEGTYADNSVELPEGIEPMSFRNYKITDLIDEPTVVAYDTKGNPVDVTLLNKEFRVSIGNDQELYDAYADYCITAVRNYAIYMADDGWFGMVDKYFESGTETYRFIKETEVSFVWDHDRYDFTNVSASDFHQYAEGVFTCRVKMQQNLYLAGQLPYHDYIDLMLCFRKKGNNYLVYSLKTTGKQ